MAQPQTASITLVAAVATAVAASQAPGAAGPLLINGSLATGGVATFPVARRVLVTTTGAGGQLLVIAGLDRARNAITETVTLPSSGFVQTAQDFLVVTSAIISGSAAALTIGSSAVGSTRWIVLDTNRLVFNAGVAVNLGGVTAGVTVEYTLDSVDKSFVDSATGGNPDSSLVGVASSAFIAPVPFSAAGLTAISADAAVAFTVPARAVRLTVNSGAATAGVRITVMQSGI